MTAGSTARPAANRSPATSSATAPAAQVRAGSPSAAARAAHRARMPSRTAWRLSPPGSCQAEAASAARSSPLAGRLAEPRPGRGERTELELGLGRQAGDGLQQFVHVGHLEPGAEDAQQPQALAAAASRPEPAGPTGCAGDLALGYGERLLRPEASP